MDVRHGRQYKQVVQGENATDAMNRFRRNYNRNLYEIVNVQLSYLVPGVSLCKVYGRL